jgi:hypothetical protein
MSLLLAPSEVLLQRKFPDGFILPEWLWTDAVSRWTYTSSDAPKYFIGHTINLVGQIIVFFLAIFGILYCAWENKQRAAGKRDHRLAGLTEEQQVHLGSRHPAFRYIQ